MSIARSIPITASASAEAGAELIRASEKSRAHQSISAPNDRSCCRSRLRGEAYQPQFRAARYWALAPGFPREVVDGRHDAEPPAVVDNTGRVKVPGMIGALRHRHRRSGTRGSLAPAASSQLQPFFAVEPVRSFLWFMMRPRVWPECAAGDTPNRRQMAASSRSRARMLASSGRQPQQRTEVCSAQAPNTPAAR
jgi:hypothetical protein